jgi:predicted nucleic acid-binding protein
MAVLLLAKSEGLVSAVRPLLEGVRAKGLRVDERLFQHVLGLAGE